MNYYQKLFLRIYHLVTINPGLSAGHANCEVPISHSSRAIEGMHLLSPVAEAAVPQAGMGCEDWLQRLALALTASAMGTVLKTWVLVTGLSLPSVDKL